MDAGRITMLKQVPIFEGLENEQLQLLAQHSRRRTFRAEEALFHQGDPGQTLYIILTGRVNIQMVSSNGNNIHIAQRGPGDHFGELSLIDGKPRMADVVTTEPCELLMLDREDFLQCLEQKPQIALKVMASLADRLRQSADRLESQQSRDVLGRVAEILLDLVNEASEDISSGGKRIVQKITQQQMAEQIGTTRESVNRALSLLKEMRVLEIEGRQIIVLNKKKLKQCSER